MTVVSRMRIERQTDGRQLLVGSLLMPLDQGALIHLVKSADGQYSLVAVTGCGRDGGDRSKQSLLSFITSEQAGLGAADV